MSDKFVLDILKNYSKNAYSGRMLDYFETIKDVYNDIWSEDIGIANLLHDGYMEFLSKDMQKLLTSIENGSIKQTMEVFDASLPLLKEKVLSVYKNTTVKVDSTNGDIKVDIDHRNMVEIFLLSKSMILLAPQFIQATLIKCKEGNHEPSANLTQFISTHFNELLPYSLNEVGKVMVNLPEAIPVDPSLYLILSNSFEISARTVYSYVQGAIPDHLVTCGSVISDLLDGDNGVGSIIVSVSEKLRQLSN